MAKFGAKITGLPKVLGALDDEVKKARGILGPELIGCGLDIQADSQDKTPVDLANLKASAFTVWATGGETVAIFNSEDEVAAAEFAARHAAVTAEEKSEISRNPDKPGVTVGHTAIYALPVHENLTAFHDDGEAKFLEKSAKKNIPLCVQRIKMKYK